MGQSTKRPSHGFIIYHVQKVGLLSTEAADSEINVLLNWGEADGLKVSLKLLEVGVATLASHIEGGATRGVVNNLAGSLYAETTQIVVDLFACGMRYLATKSRGGQPHSLGQFGHVPFA